MLNLISEEQKKILKKDYIVRFLILFSGLLSFVLLLSIIALVPSFVLVQVENRILKPQKDAIEAVSNSDEVDLFEERIVDINNKIKLLDEPELVPSDLITEILSYQIRSVKINTVEYLVDEDNEASIVLSGVANNRESLVEFGDFIEQSGSFYDIDIPFSSFTMSTDVPFTLNVKVKEKQNE